MMYRTFVMTRQFDKDWERLGLDDDALLNLQNKLMKNPKTGDVIQGLDGARKIRVSLPGRGKRGGGRVIYVDVIMDETIFLLTAYAKNEQSDLTKNQKKLLQEIIKELREE